MSFKESEELFLSILKEFKFRLYNQDTSIKFLELISKKKDNNEETLLLPIFKEIITIINNKFDAFFSSLYLDKERFLIDAKIVFSESDLKIILFIINTWDDCVENEHPSWTVELNFLFLILNTLFSFKKGSLISASFAPVFQKDFRVIDILNNPIETTGNNLEKEIFVKFTELSSGYIGSKSGVIFMLPKNGREYGEFSTFSFSNTHMENFISSAVKLGYELKVEITLSYNNFTYCRVDEAYLVSKLPFLLEKSQLSESIDKNSEISGIIPHGGITSDNIFVNIGVVNNKLISGALFKYPKGVRTRNLKVPGLKSGDLVRVKIRNLDFTNNRAELEYINTIPYPEYGWRKWWLPVRFIQLLLIEVLFQNDIEKKSELNKIIIYCSRDIRSPLSYIYDIKLTYYKVAKSLMYGEDVGSDLSLLKEKIKEHSDYHSTNVPFNLNSLKDSTEVLTLMSSSDRQTMLKSISLFKGKNKKILQQFLAVNLLKNEPHFNNIISQVNDSIMNLLFRSASNIFTKNSGKIVEEDEFIRLLKSIKSGGAVENNVIEFKETLRVPVHSKKVLNEINTLKKLITEKDGDEKLKKALEKISHLNIRDKSLQNRVTYSLFKNISAFLNSNRGGYIVVGVRDEPIELIGLKSDYQIYENFDGLMNLFDAKSKEIIVDHLTFERFYEPRRVVFEEKEFLIIKFNRITENKLKEACFVKDPDGDEKAYIRLNSGANEIKGRDLNIFSRDTKSLSGDEKEPCYLYLMRDANNYIKIGISKNPQKRKGTLTPESKGIELINTFKFNNRLNASKAEKYFHTKYTDYRIDNSEFFNIDESHISQIESKINDWEIF